MEYYNGWKEPWKAFGATTEEWNDWHWQLKNRIEKPSSMREIDELFFTEKQMKMMEESWSKGKPMRVTPYYLSLMGNNPTGVDPDGMSISDDINAVFVQAVPIPAYHLFRAGDKDPMAEGSRSVGAAYQRYVNRIAFMFSPSSICHMYCTHCQRSKDQRKKPSKENNRIGLRYIKDNTNIDEVLVTGGDPLAQKDPMLEPILEELSGIVHVKSIRIATRLPVTNPPRINDGSLGMIARYSKHTSGDVSKPDIGFVTHANALEELTLDMQRAVSMIRRYGFDIRNQTVLLKNVNDDFATMSRLNRNLHHMGVRPYYLFQCHKVDGFANRIVPINIGQYITFEQRGQEGSSIPKYAVNMVGGGGKVDLTPQGDMGMPDFTYMLSRRMRTWDNRILEYEELLRVRESDYENGMKVMSEFYGDESIMDYESLVLSDNLDVRETSSNKYRPSMIVVDDKNTSKIKYVTNVMAPEPMQRDEKLGAMGFEKVGPKLGHPDELYVTNPGKIAELYI
jgi:KamA family protein